MYNIVIDGNWCPKCVNKTENEVYKFLSNYDAERSIKFNWCKNLDTNKHLPFDILLVKFNIIIEVDGPQHFFQISNWKSPQYNLLRDNYKAKCAIENGYSLIRISQEDVRNNKIDWKTLLTESIKEYQSPTIIYISKDKELYSLHKDLFENGCELEFID